MKFSYTTAVSTIALIAGLANIGHAQPYPSKVVRLVVASAPGGGSDLVARTLASKLGPSLGQQVIAENRPGAGGRIGAEVVAKAAPDGYTLLVGTSSLMVITPRRSPATNY